MRSSFDGFTRSPLTWTRPPSTACAAARRVLKRRAAHNHLSTLTSFTGMGAEPRSSTLLAESHGRYSAQRVLHRSAPLADKAVRLVFAQLRLVALRRAECLRDLVL